VNKGKVDAAIEIGKALKRFVGV